MNESLIRDLICGCINAGRPEFLNGNAAERDGGEGEK
jgi:hypothetical protein